MRIIKEHTIGLVIDIQERLLPHMAAKEELLQNTAKLLEGLKVLEVPMLLTEQYRKGLGETVGEVKERFTTFRPQEKMTFSCCDDKEFTGKLRDSEKKFVVVCGIETHVCVLQTVVDLLEEGYQPVVIEDCTSSRNLADKQSAIERMRQEGARIATVESILFELARISGTDQFKAISKLVK